MEISRGNLRTLGIGFKATFQKAFAGYAPMYTGIATVVPSTNQSEDYGWLGDLPRVREWLGDRQINNLRNFSYTIRNKDWESTLEVDRNAILFDNLGIYSTKLDALGKAGASFWDELIWPMLNAGFTSLCYDGQYFFDTDHPVLDKNGVELSVVNTDGGSGTPWFLTAKNASVKPVVLQKAKDFEFVSKDAPNDDGVFWQKKFYYGIDAIANVGYGFWQTAWGSKQTLDTTHYNAAMAALSGMKGDFERPIGNVGADLWVPASLRAQALGIVNAQYNADGSSNVNYQTADLHIIPWL